MTKVLQPTEIKIEPIIKNKQLLGKLLMSTKHARVPLVTISNNVLSIQTEYNYNKQTQTFSITIDLTAEEIKFRANDGWDWNYGDTGADGELDNGGDNIVVPEAGNYTVVLDLSNPRAYTYTLTLN